MEKGVAMEFASKKVILLVEDEAIIAMMQKASLETYGYEVILASTGEAAVRMANNAPTIDLVLMDVDLGMGINGTTAARAILKTRNIPVVFLSSHTEPEIVGLTEVITSYGYVVKNSGITVLDASIKMAFKLFEAKRFIEDEKEHLRMTLNSIGDGVLATDTQGRVTRMNPWAEQLTGWKLANAQGKPLQDVFRIINAETRAPIEFSIPSLLELDRPARLEKSTILISREGAEYRIADSVAAIQGTDGAVNGVVLVFRDVTEECKIQEDLRIHQIELEMQNEQLRTTQRELETSRQRYFEMYDLAPVGCCTLSENGIVLEANLTLANMLCVPRGALLQHPVSSLIFPADQDIYYQHRKLLLDKSEAQIFGLRLAVANASPVNLQIQMTQAQGPGGAPMIRLVVIPAQNQAV